MTASVFRSDPDAESEVMSRAECLQRLAGTDVGRIGLSVDAMPVILPMAFALLDDDVVIRAGWSDKLAAAVHQRVVCFEADGIETADGGGWSVLVTGRAEIIRSPQLLERAGRLPLRPWPARSTDRFIRIPAEVVSGRRARPLG